MPPSGEEAPPEEEESDFSIPFLSQAEHLLSAMLNPERKPDSNRFLWALLLQAMTLGAGVYLYRYSDLPYLLGLRKRRGG